MPTIFRNYILKKWLAALDASPEMAGGTSRKAGPIRTFAGSNTPAKVLKSPFSVFKPACHKRWPKVYNEINIAKKNGVG